jgi:hypothetical protein
MIAPGVSSTMRSTPVASSSVDEIDAGGELERSDVTPLAADDAALQVVARQVDHGHRGLDGVLGGGALNCFGDVLLGPIAGHLAGLGVEPLQQVGGVVARLAFNLLEKKLLGLLGGKAGDALELVLLLRDEPVVFLRGGLGRPLAVGDRLLASLQVFLGAIGGNLPFGERGLAADQRLLEGLRLLPFLAGLLFGLRQQVVGFLLSFEEGFLLAGFYIALGVLHDAKGLLFGATDGFGGDSFAVGHPDGEHGGGRHQGDQDIDQVPEIRQHA